MNEDGGDKNRGFRKICLFCRIKAAGTGFEFWMKSILSKSSFIQLKFLFNSIFHLANVDEDGEDDHGNEEEGDADPDEPHLLQLHCHCLHLISSKIKIILIGTNLPGVPHFRPLF